MPAKRWPRQAGVVLPTIGFVGLGHMGGAMAGRLLGAGHRLVIPLPTADRADEILTAAHRLGYDRRDIAALYEVLEQLAA
jgi:3-hydroxyisobutyrate dehydrogenase-like beta-hydroxyacid dehydrogenase